MLDNNSRGDWHNPPPTTIPDIYFESALTSGCSEHVMMHVDTFASGQCRDGREALGTTAAESPA